MPTLSQLLRTAALCLAVGGALLAGACATAPQAVDALPLNALQTDPASNPAYRVARGDELNFRFVNTPELNTVANVRSDGRLTLPMAGEFTAEGLTMPELSALVERLLTPQVRRPQVAVNVQGASTQRVFVGGEVVRPGLQPLLGPLTALQAVMVAEGIKESGQPRQAIVVRRGAQGERQVLSLDLGAAMDGSDVSQDVALRPYDMVIIPRSGVANVNLWIDQYIRRMIPFSTGLSYQLNRNGVVP